MIQYLSEKLKVRKSLLYILILVIILATYQFLISKEITHITDVKKQIAELRIQLVEIEEAVAELDTQNLKEIEQKSPETKIINDVGLDSPLVLLDVCRYIEEAHLDIIGFQAQPSVDLKDFQYRIYNLVLKGDYESFLEWLKFMEEMPYYLNIGELYSSKVLISTENLSTILQEEFIFLVSINNIGFDNSR